MIAGPLNSVEIVPCHKIIQILSFTQQWTIWVSSPSCPSPPDPVLLPHSPTPSSAPSPPPPCSCHASALLMSCQCLKWQQVCIFLNPLLIWFPLHGGMLSLTSTWQITQLSRLPPWSLLVLSVDSSLPLLWFTYLLKHSAFVQEAFPTGLWIIKGQGLFS